eukprot:COSAG06_NODE_250_length_19080_cov_6.483029_18_plen_228_part_00
MADTPADEEQDPGQERAPLAPTSDDGPSESEPPSEASSEWQLVAPGDDDGADAAAPMPSSSKHTRRRYGAAVGLVVVLVGAALVAWASFFPPRVVIIPTAASTGYSSNLHSGCSWSDSQWSAEDGHYYHCEMTDNYEKFELQYHSVNNDNIHVFMGWTETEYDCRFYPHDHDWAPGWKSVFSHDNLHHSSTHWLSNNEYRHNHACFSFRCHNRWEDCQIEVDYIGIH